MAWLFFAVGFYLLLGAAARKWPETFAGLHRKPTATPVLNLILGIFCLLIGWGIASLPDMSDTPDETSPPAQAAAANTAPVAAASTLPPAPKPEPLRETIYEAPKIIAAYKANEIAADNRFKGHSILIAGYVSEIEKDFLGDPVVRLEGGEYELFGLACTFKRTEMEKLAALRRGQALLLRGKVTGMIVGIVGADGCEVVKVR